MAHSAGHSGNESGQVGIVEERGVPKQAGHQPVKEIPAGHMQDVAYAKEAAGQDPEIAPFFLEGSIIWAMD